MPTRVTPMQMAANANPYAPQSRTSDASRNDDSGSGAEGPARKRLQKSPSNGKGTERRLTTTASSLKSAAEPKSNFTSRRRQSIRDQKVPLGPRPPEFSTKRSVSGNVFNSANGATSDPSTDPHSQQYSINSISRFSFASIPPQHTPKDENENPAGSSDFLAPINFDDFHNSITADEPSLSHFPLPGGGGGLFHTVPGENKGTGQAISTGINCQTPQAGQLGRAGSLMRQQSNASRQVSQTSSTSDSMGSSVASSTLRSRRQSHLPPPSSNPAVTRHPRKSIGPGTFSVDITENAAPKRKPSVTARKNSTEQIRPEPAALSLRLNNRVAETNRGVGSKFLAATRNMKAKSLQPPQREPQDHLLTPSRTPDHSRSSSTNPARTPRSAAGRTGTPSSSNKRMSVMPPHATGLGARTISPTDARRMKRLSTMQPPPRVPQTPPTPQPEPLPSRPRSFVQSPSMIPRKSVTPSSSRTTPDLNRKSYSSGVSLSSSTSYNSIRNSNGSIQPRLPLSISTSRLPTPKPRLDTTGVANEEEVPPVPAIPKAYESPQNEIDQPFFSARKSSLPLETSSSHSSPVVDSIYSTPIIDHTKEDPEVCLRRPATIYDPDTKPKPAPNIGKKNLQPLRLPPLNLLPLSTPIASRVKNFSEIRNEVSGTPPPRHATTKTPSTPMTASKASFFSRSYRDNDDGPVSQIRSSSSHHAIRPESSAFRVPSSSSAINIPGAFESLAGPRTISPYISSSLPKNSRDYGYMRPKFSGEYNRTNAGARLTGPRAQAASQNTKEDVAVHTEPESTFSASSIRRKLSLTRKRSTSKAQTRSEKEAEPLKYDNMPPPKLPASATWSNLANAGTSPTSMPDYLKSRRKTSASSMANGSSRVRSQSSTSDQSPKISAEQPREALDLDGSQNRLASSAMSPVQSVLGSRPPPSTQRRPQDADLDRDDLIAEEEMRKLASRRKDFESAARELDELQRRATPKERVSPAQALRMANLNIFERGEIIDYKEIYFCGTQNAKKLVGDLNAQSANFGYDDERGDYNIIEGDHLSYRYEVVDILGKGSFGQVVRCLDHKTGALVAVKIIRNKKRFHQQALVEVNILQKLREWDPGHQHSVVNFTQNFYFRGHLCISTELLGMNLYEFIKAHDFRGFSLNLIRRFTKQLLSSLVLLNGHKVIHCDLKPENILLAHPIHSEIKVIDFGSSCFENEKVYTYIQSRFYRSPEVILGMSYGMPIDMWSLGCILAELYTGYPIFPGENEQEQLACIMEVFGPPEKRLIEQSSRKKLFFDSLGKPRLTVSSKGRRRRPSSKELRQALKCDDEGFLDFITRCLRWDPARRINPHEAMVHEFITGVKLNTRSRPPPTTTNHASPIKRVNSVTTPSASRPLPEPPATSFKNGTAVRNRYVPSSSPIKAAAPKRHSTINGLQTTVGVKRASNGAAIGSSALPRVATRSFSGKPDLATAAAATSLKMR